MYRRLLARVPSPPRSRPRGRNCQAGEPEKKKKKCKNGWTGARSHAHTRQRRRAGVLPYPVTVRNRGGRPTGGGAPPHGTARDGRRGLQRRGGRGRPRAVCKSPTGLYRGDERGERGEGEERPAGGATSRPPTAPLTGHLLPRWRPPRHETRNTAHGRHREGAGWGERKGGKGCSALPAPSTHSSVSTPYSLNQSSPPHRRVARAARDGGAAAAPPAWRRNAPPSPPPPPPAVAAAAATGRRHCRHPLPP